EPEPHILDIFDLESVFDAELPEDPVNRLDQGERIDRTRQFDLPLLPLEFDEREEADQIRSAGMEELRGIFSADANVIGGAARWTVDAGRDPPRRADVAHIAEQRRELLERSIIQEKEFDRPRRYIFRSVPSSIEVRHEMAEFDDNPRYGYGFISPEH